MSDRRIEQMVKAIIESAIFKIKELDIRPVNTPNSIKWVKQKEVIQILEDFINGEV